MKDLITHLFPPKEIHIHKRYLRRGFYKPCDTKIRDFICKINKIVDYLKKLPIFGYNQGLPEDDIIELVKLFLPREWQKELIIQEFYSATQGLTEFVNFCERLETSEEIFQMQGEGPHKKTQSIECHQSFKSVQSKKSYQAANPLKENTNKKLN